ncbi:hypothetical protein JOM56_009680 [Amanita muscaria]
MTEYVGSSETIQPLSQLEAGHLYAVLTYRGELASWNWAFFIPDPSVPPIGAFGTVFHVVHETEELKMVWKFTRERKEVLTSPLVVTMVRLADVSFMGQYQDLIVSEDLIGMFNQVKVPAGDPLEFSSRAWFLDAITILNECGVLTCDDVWNLEREIRRLGFTAMDKYLQNKGWTIFNAEHCS